MSVFKCLAVLCVLAHIVMGAGEYQPQPPGGDDTRTQFDIPPPPRPNTDGGRDESRDPSRWIMNLVSTRLPPWKRYRRPTTQTPKALAQGATEAYSDDIMGLSVNPE